MTWIPVTERLPSGDGSVLICTDTGPSPVWIGWHDHDGWFWDNGDGCDRVTHWMPLPNPPATVRKGETMNEKRLDALRTRAARATELAERIMTLRSADPYQHVTLEFKTWNTAENLLPNDLLKEAIKEGCRVLIEKAEAELESLIVVEPAHSS